MKLSKIETHKSKTFPGVFFVIHKITEPRRQEFRLAIAGIHEKLRELSTEQEAIEKDPAAKQRYNEIEAAITQLSDVEMNPAWVKHFLLDIFYKDPSDLTSKVEVDDEIVTPENFQRLVPAAMYSEVVSLIRERAALGGMEIKNSELPSTSPDPVDGQTNSTTA